MKAAIIAAGQGERLRAAGYLQPKPLVPVGGRALIDYTLAAVDAAGIRQVACIVNEESVGIEDHCYGAWPNLRFEFVRRTTPSSMESLFSLEPLVGEARFVLLTVDSIFSPGVLQSFLAAVDERKEADGVLALTSFVEDEKPLWARIDSQKRILELGAAAKDGGWITAGFYSFAPSIFREIETARASHFTALRQFLGCLVSSGYAIYGEPVGKSVDVDRAEDIAIAEDFIGCGYRS